MEPTSPDSPVSGDALGGRRAHHLLLIAGASAILLVAVAILAYFWFRAVPQEGVDEDARKQLESASAALEASAETPPTPPSANPVKNVTSAENPIEKTNPFNYEYKNPFE